MNRVISQRKKRGTFDTSPDDLRLRPKPRTPPDPNKPALVRTPPTPRPAPQTGKITGSLTETGQARIQKAKQQQKTEELEDLKERFLLWRRRNHK